MSEEVKVNIRTEADTRGLDATQAKIKELRAEAEKQRGHADRYASKFGFEDVTARTSRASAAALEREANRLERPINAEQKSAHKSERDQMAAGLREQRNAERTAAREASEEKRKFAAEDRARKKTEHTEEKAAARELHVEETQRQRFGRAGMHLGMQAAQGGSLSGGIGSLASAMGPAGMAGVAAIAAVAVGKIAGEVWTEITERKGIALRDQAAQKMNARGLAISAGWRGTAGGVQAERFATEQRMAEREANREELARKGERDPWNPLRWFGSKQTFASQRELADNDVAQKRDAKLAKDQKEQAKKKWREEEGGIEMDHAVHRAERTQSGQRAAYVDEQKQRWLQRYRSLQKEGATEADAAKIAGLETETAMRDRQIAAGSGLVDARSGAGDIAAAARWAGMSTPGMAEVARAIEAQHATIKENSKKAEELNNRKDQSVP